MEGVEGLVPCEPFKELLVVSWGSFFCVVFKMEKISLQLERREGGRKEEGGETGERRNRRRDIRFVFLKKPISRPISGYARLRAGINERYAFFMEYPSCLFISKEEGRKGRGRGKE